MKVALAVLALFLLGAPSLGALSPDCTAVPGSTLKETRVHEPDNLFDYMDGGAEGYITYSFLKLNGVTCVLNGTRFILDISEMATPDFAYGLFVSNYDSRKPTEKLGAIAQVMGARATLVKDKYFVEVSMDAPGEHSAEIRPVIAALEKRIAGTATLPKEITWFAAEKRTAPLVRMVPESVLGMGALPKGFVTEYAFGKAFLVITAGPEAAAAAMKKVQGRFAGAAPVKVGEQAFEATDQYLGRMVFFRKGAYIAGFNALAEGEDGVAQAAAFAARIP